MHAAWRRFRHCDNVKVFIIFRGPTGSACFSLHHLHWLSRALPAWQCARSFAASRSLIDRLASHIIGGTKWGRMRWARALQLAAVLAPPSARVYSTTWVDEYPFVFTDVPTRNSSTGTPAALSALPLGNADFSLRCAPHPSTTTS